MTTSFLTLGPEPAFGWLGVMDRWEDTVLMGTLLAKALKDSLQALKGPGSPGRLFEGPGRLFVGL